MSTVLLPELLRKPIGWWRGRGAMPGKDSATSAEEAAPVAASNRLLQGQGQDIHDVAASLSGLHNMLKYDQYDPDKGLFINDNSLSFAFEVAPQTGADAEMATRLTQLFTPIPPGYGVQWTLAATPDLDDEFDRYVELRQIAVDQGLTSDFFVELARRRVEHFQRSKGLSLLAQTHYVIKRIRLVFSVTKTGSSQDATLCEELVDLKETLSGQLRAAGLPAKPMDAQDLLRFIHPLLNPTQMFEAERAPVVMYDEGRSIKHQATSFGHAARVEKTAVFFDPCDGEADDAPDRKPRIAMRAYGVRNYPHKRELWEMANLIGHLFDDGLQYACPFVICLGVFTLDASATSTQVALRAARANQNARSRMAEFQPELATKARDWNTVSHQIGAGGTLTRLYHTLLLYAPEHLAKRCEQVAKNIWKAARFDIEPLHRIHLAGLYASLPMTLTDGAARDLGTLKLMTHKTTVNAVDMSPVLSEWPGAGEPVMMFPGRRGVPAFLDFYANKQGNYNVFVAGVSGAGKSVAMNEMVASYRGVGARVWVIDVGRSYKNLIKLQKGTFIEFTTERPICINPFSWVGMDSANSFNEELRLLKPMVGRMCSPTAPLSEFQYSLVGEAITAVWKDYGPDTNPTLIQQYLLHKMSDEQGQPERQAYELAKQLQPFTQDGIYGAYFNGRANLSLDGDMIGLELEELKGAPDLRRVVLFVLTSRIAHDMYLSRDRRKLCLMDEAWQLLGHDKETAEFIAEGYRRARKYNGIFCVGTQGIQDAFVNQASEAAYNNADWKIFLRQDIETLEKLIKDGVIDFSPAVKRMITSLRTEHGQYAEMLVSSPNGQAVVRNILDPFSLLMASSTAADFVRFEQMEAQGYSTVDMLDTLLRERGHRV